MAENTTASRRVQAAEREKAAFALRIAGATYAQIGAQLGVTGCAAHKMVKRVLERTRGETDAEAVELRRLETERLDALQVALWGLASKGTVGYTASTSSVNWSGMTCNYFASDGHIESAPLD